MTPIEQIYLQQNQNVNTQPRKNYNLTVQDIPGYSLFNTIGNAFDSFTKPFVDLSRQQTMGRNQYLMGEQSRQREAERLMQNRINNQVTQEALQKGVGGAYNLETGEMKQQPGLLNSFMSSFDEMSPEQVGNLVSGIQGLLDATEPSVPELKPVSIPSATAGLRLTPMDMSQFYQGLLRRN